LVVEEQVSLVSACVVLGNHKSEANSWLGPQVSGRGDIRVEIFYSVPVFDGVVQSIDHSCRLPVEKFNDVVDRCVLDGVARTDYADNRGVLLRQYERIFFETVFWQEK